MNFFRRKPTQNRSQKTIDTIFEATAQILNVEEAKDLNTKKIADKAGFSIGTLYQYFPNKESIIKVMLKHNRDRVLADLDKLLRSFENDPTILTRDPIPLVRAVVHMIVAGFGTGNAVKMGLIRLSWQNDSLPTVVNAIREGSDRIAEAIQRVNHPAFKDTSNMSMFVASRALLGVVRSASLEQSAYLGTPEFEDELVKLVWPMLKKEN